MVAKRFRTRRYRSNLTAWAWTCAAFGLGLSVLALALGNLHIITIFLAVALTGGVIAWWRDRMPDISYTLDRDRITLTRAGIQRHCAPEQLMDANLMDRAAARDYVLQTVRSKGLQDRAVRKETSNMLTYCTVDIGMHSLSFGIGRSMLDRMPNGKDDLVLLRLRTGEQFLLSPVHQHELIKAVAQMVLQAAPRPAMEPELTVAHTLSNAERRA